MSILDSFPQRIIRTEFRGGRQLTRSTPTCHSPLLSVCKADDEWLYCRESYPNGAWRRFPTRVDMLLGFVAEELGLVLEFGGIKLLEGYCKIHSAQISRARVGIGGIPESWIFRLHQFAGIPLFELYQLVGLEPTSPHPNARKETP